MGRGNSRVTKRNCNRNNRSYRKFKRMSTGIRNNSTVSVKVPAIRDFTIFSSLPSSSDSLITACLNSSVNKSVWLNALKAVGAFALKIFLVTLTSAQTLIVNGKKISATKTYIASAVQSVFIGAEDLLWSSPLIEFEDKRSGDPPVVTKVPCIDYRQARMTNAILRITPGSDWSKRAGRYAACCMNISEEEIATYLDTKSSSNLLRHDGWTFEDVVQMPGAVVASFGTPITLKWRAHPYSYANRFLAIGQPSIDGWDFTKNLRGGKPSFRLIVAYQSFASATGDVADTYNANEALVQLDIRAKISLIESGRAYIRSWPLTTMTTDAAGVYGKHGKIERQVLLQQLTMVDGSLHLLEEEQLSLNDLTMEG